MAIPFVEVLLLFIAIYLGYHLLKKKRDPRYPPGPSYALPVLGNILQLGSEPQRVFEKWAKEYGKVFSFKMGSNDVVMINDAKMIKDIFSDASSAGRMANPILLALANGNYGIVLGEGPHWEQQRRFTLRTLRDLGLAKSAMEGIILEEVNAMIKFFEKNAGKPINGNRIFNGAVVNSIWSIISGEREDWDGDEPPEILKIATDIITTVNRTNESGLMFCPALRHIAPDHFEWTKWISSIASIVDICNKSIDKHKRNLDPDNPTDLIDHYLIEMKNTTDPTSSFYKDMGEKNLSASIPDLFLAGSETTSHSLSWLMLHLAHNPKVLKKLQDELDTVVGTNRQPSIADRPNLPYAEVITMEILRRTAVGNLGIPHRMLQDAVINGYFLPKNATIISNIFSVQNDPKVWGDPENFRPERFLSEDGTRIVKHEAFIPFSAGKRVCPGESLAKDTLFLFTTCIAQKFDIKPAPGGNSEKVVKDVHPTNKMINEPKPFQMVVSLRK